jgi:urea transport system ATP-binding protein
VVALLGRSGEMASLLVEQYFDFAHELADRIAVMDRGEIVMDESSAAIDPAMFGAGSRCKAI